MVFQPRGLVLVVALVMLGLAGCSSSEVSPGNQDIAVATPSVAGAVTVVNGGSKSFSLSFNSSGSSTLSELSVTSGLLTLPTGWSGPSAFNCANVSSGSGCVLTLTYTPAAAASGVLTIAYRYLDGGGLVQNAAISIPYASTAHDTVSATAAPTGQINAAVGASQAVALAFTTDDGNLATALTMTSDLSALPAGWSSTAQSFTCATVGTGSGCLLPLTFAPSAAGAGTLTLNYSYTDNAGAAKTGSVNLAYAATGDNNIVGTAAPSGQINAVIGGASQAVAVSFTTDDHNAATALVLATDLSALPSGWSALESSFTCATVATGNGCQLHLSYAPGAAGAGTLTLSYGYRDTAGTAKTGSLNIAYAATLHNNVISTPSPSGQVNAVAGSGGQSVTVNFTTDNGVVSGLSMTTALNSLPSGWTSTATSFVCANVRTSGNTCQLPLIYAPSSAGSGALTLNYSYTNNASSAVTGTVSIPYASTAHDTVSGALSPSGTLSVAVGGSQAVTVIFTSSDGNEASGLAIGSSGSGGLGSLPDGWAAAGGASTFTCSSVSTGTGCELDLTYAPSSITNGTLALSFSYLDNAGSSQNGTVNIAYAAAAQHAYVSDSNNGLYICSVDGTTGSLANCQTTGSGFSGAWSVAFFSGNSANYAYVVDGQRTNVYLCTVNSDGTLSNCTSQAGQSGNYTYPEHAAVVGSKLYLANQGNIGGDVVTVCGISSTDGTLTSCSLTGSAGGLNYASGITLDGSFAYVATDNNGLFSCGVDATNGSLTNCAPATTSGSSVGAAWNVAVSGGTAYLANAQSGLTTCTIGSGGDLSACSDTSLTSGFPQMATGVALNGGLAYLSTLNFFFGTGNIYLCSISGITASGCRAAVSDGSDGGFSYFLADVIIY